ncbi:tetratricopeptide repeat protein [Candidatus Omnitrophota bacterium]
MTHSGDFDFEVSFYENLLKEKPDYIDALVALGDAYTKAGRYEDGLSIDKRLAKLKPDDTTVHYNLACSYSLLKKPDLCIEVLKKALEFGYCDFVFMEEDPDLEYIRKDERYKDLVSKYSKLK